MDNPAVCGPAVTTADLTPWSAPGVTPEGFSMPGTPDVTPSSLYKVEGCSILPRLPGIGRGDGHAAGRAVQRVHAEPLPSRSRTVRQGHPDPYSTGIVGDALQCPACVKNPWRIRGTCPASSRIGTTRVASGAGSHPFEIEGTVYLTGPYDGAPFGLSIVTPAVAGPFNLGLVVVRARIDVNPADSTLTVTTMKRVRMRCRRSWMVCRCA